MQKSQILIVEDDLDLSEMLTAFLRAHNYEVQTAAWGQDALVLAEKTPFDLIILDIRLPDIDGFEVCRQLHLQRKTKDLPIIFLTEKRDRVDRLHGLELGVVDYITKPFDIQEIRLRVRNILTRSARHSMLNPVTGLAEGPLVDEILADLLNSDHNWAVISAVIEGIDVFAERYGFLATDDMLRAMTLILRNALREFVGDTEQIGHLNGTQTFIMVAPPEKLEAVRSRITDRINQSREFFLPSRDRDLLSQAEHANLLRLKSATLLRTSFDDTEAFRAALAVKVS